MSFVNVFQLLIAVKIRMIIPILSAVENYGAKLCVRLEDAHLVLNIHLMETVFLQHQIGGDCKIPFNLKKLRFETQEIGQFQEFYKKDLYSMSLKLQENTPLGSHQSVHG